MPDAHSKYSASGFEAAMLCPGKRVMERGLPDPGSKYADEGTAAHTLLSWCLDEAKDAKAYLGRRIPVGMQTFEVTGEMAEAVQTAVDNIRDIVGDGMLLSEQIVTYAPHIGVPDDEGWGTSDVIAARGDELQVHDYKHGRGVEVDAGGDGPNPQMALYALGALRAVQDTLGPVEAVRLVIHQPRIKSAPSEYTLTVKELLDWSVHTAQRSVDEQQGAERMHGHASLTQAQWEKVYLRPKEKSCKFCRAKATCPALRNEVADTVGNKISPGANADEFDIVDEKTIQRAPNTHLSRVMSKIDLIEDWCKAVRAEVERRLLAGQAVPGWKVVQGKRGNRAWSDDEAAEKMLREQFRLKVEQAYDLKLISPTSAEKLAKAGVIGPRQWKQAQALITQADGKPHVAPDSDPRPAIDIRPVAEDFDNVPDFA